MKKKSSKIFYTVIILALLAVSGRLFFYENILNIKDIFFPQDSLKQAAQETLKITYPLPFNSYEPTNNEPNNRALLNNIYEPLVKTDKNLKIVPGLALSWGRTDDLTWEFKLRPNVEFHNGEELTVQNIKESINRGVNNPNSQISNLLNNIFAIEEIGDYKFRLTTYEKDPLLLNKLSLLLIIPLENNDNLDQNPVGTGPYKFVKKAGNETNLEYFTDYWGAAPTYKSVLLKTQSAKKGRIDELKNDEVDISINVPQEIKDDLSENYDLKIIPSLEVNFLAWNLDPKNEDNILLSKEIRKAISHAIDKQKLVEFTGGVAHEVNQYVSNGIFGYSPDVDAPEYDLSKAIEIMEDLDLDSPPILTLDLAEGLEILGSYFQDVFYKIGIILELNLIPLEELEFRITNEDSLFYFFGWRSELGDASDFLQQVAHSKTTDLTYGKYNGGYKNEEIDKHIEESDETLDEKSRLAQLQQLMKILVEEEYIGVPLIETDNIYAVKKGIEWSPRVDGFVYAIDIK